MSQRCCSLFLVSLAFGNVGEESSEASFQLTSVMWLLTKEALAGLFLGLISGFFAFWLLRQIDDYVLEVLITLALVTAAYSIALHLHLSGPIAMVIAGLLIGNQGTSLAMSETTRMHVETFWELVDAILNSILFLLIGLKIVFFLQYSSYGITYPLLISLFVAITILSLFARFLAIALPVEIKSLNSELNPGAVPILTWAGIRGGVSVALALSLPSSSESELLLFITYLVVLFSVTVQGLTIENVIKCYYS